MEQSELLRFIVTVLEDLGLKYFVTGSVATTYYGEPRLTNDIDVVVALPGDRVAELCRSFHSPEFYVSEDAARQAVRDGGQFNVIHPTSGLKVDIVVPADTAFNRSRFARANRVRPADEYQATFSSPEDVIIKKLEFYREGGSEKHLRDIASVLRISGHQIDYAYIGDWASRLDLVELWVAVQESGSG